MAGKYKYTLEIEFNAPSTGYHPVHIQVKHGTVISDFDGPTLKGQLKEVMAYILEEQNM